MIAHRGWPTRYPDNTLAGFLAAAAVADMIELDVRRSADGKLVLAHDLTLGGLGVATTPWAELAEIDLGGGHHPALLDEVLAAVPETPAQLEVKNMPYEPDFEPDHRLALEAADRARPHDIVTSFNRATVEAVRRDFDDVATGLAVGYPDSLDEAVDYCMGFGHTCLAPAAGLVSGSVEGVVRSGVAVYPWTVNDVDVAMELVEAGVSGIITDDPGRIARVIRGDT